MHCPGNVAILPQTRLIYSSLPKTVNQFVPALDICVADYVFRATTEASLDELEWLREFFPDRMNPLRDSVLDSVKSAEDGLFLGSKEIQALEGSQNETSILTSLAPVEKLYIGTSFWFNLAQRVSPDTRDSFVHLFCARRKWVHYEHECRMAMAKNLTIEGQDFRDKFVAAVLEDQDADPQAYAKAMANATVWHVNQLAQRIPRFNEVVLANIDVKFQAKPVSSWLESARQVAKSFFAVVGGCIFLHRVVWSRLSS